ncbi:MAG: glycosyltransferase family 2 protein [Allosphingosinicella sp.]
MLPRFLKPFGLRTRVREDLRSAGDLGLGAMLRFRAERRSQAYRAVFDDPEPLVTICIGTYNRAHLLLERSVRSALGQTWRNVEVIVVGDCCTDDTDAVMRSVKDDRLKWINLEQRGQYPQDPDKRWMVAGTVPFNRAMAEAKGSFVTHLDDDDEHAPDRVEKLVKFIRSTRADLVYHPFESEEESGAWTVNPAAHFMLGRVTTSSIFYHRRLTAIPWDLDAHLYREPGDWNRLRKIRYLGAKIRRYPEPLLKHYRERSQAKAAPAPS